MNIGGSGASIGYSYNAMHTNSCRQHRSLLDNAYRINPRRGTGSEMCQPTAHVPPYITGS